MICQLCVVSCVLCVVCCVLLAVSMFSGSCQWVGAFGAFEEYFEKKKQNETERFHYELQLRLLLRHLFCLSLSISLCAKTISLLLQK
jgi:hypothetical protein